MVAIEFALSSAVALLGMASHVSAQAIGVSTVQCMNSFGWANNSLDQNPCLVTAYLQAQCAGGTFTIKPLDPGYHYIGPTNDTSTQNACICSTPVYMLESACGACHNRTFISWSSWHFYCPAEMLQEEGTYSQIIPSGTLVPHWAYLKPSDYSDFFNADTARLAGDTPESSQVKLSTTSSRSTTSTLTTTSPPATSNSISTTLSPTSTTSSGGGGGGSSTNAGAIAGGVVGGAVGLGLIALLGFWFLRNRNRPSPSPSVAHRAGGQSSTQEMSAVGGHLTGGSNGGSVANTNGQYTTGSVNASAGGSVPVGPVYNPNDPSTFPQSYGQPTYGGTPQQPQLVPQGYYAGAPAGGQPIKYSGIPEV